MSNLKNSVFLLSFSLEFWYVVADPNMTLESRFSADIADATAGRLLCTEHTLGTLGTGGALGPTWGPADGDRIPGEQGHSGHFRLKWQLMSFF